MKNLFFQYAHWQRKLSKCQARPSEPQNFMEHYFIRPVLFVTSCRLAYFMNRNPCVTSPHALWGKAGRDKNCQGK